MKFRSFLAPIVALLSLLGASTLDAQQTWIVDREGRPGSHFLQIQPAVDAAVPGDTIKVRAVAGVFGKYQSAQADKSLRLVGEPGVVVDTLDVSDLLADDVFVITGFEADRLWLYQNLGTIHVEDVEVEQDTAVWDSNQVSFSSCAFREIWSIGSQVLLTECTASGYADGNCYCPVAAVSIDYDSRFTIAGGTYAGAEAKFTWQSDSGPAIYVSNDSELFLTGSFGTTIKAGEAYIYGAPAIQANDGRVVLDPDPTLIPSGNASAITGSANVSVTRIPYLHNELQGNTLTTTVETWPGARVLVYYSPFTVPFSYSATTPDVWVGMPRRIVSATAPANGIQTNAFPLPALALGLSYPIQAAVIHNGQVYLSNPVVSTLSK